MNKYSNTRCFQNVRLFCSLTSFYINNLSFDIKPWLVTLEPGISTIFGKYFKGRGEFNKGQIKGCGVKNQNCSRPSQLVERQELWRQRAPNRDECRTQGIDMLTEKKHFSSRSDSQLIIGNDNVNFQRRSMQQQLHAEH
jgi:hypothetical protein